VARRGTPARARAHQTIGANTSAWPTVKNHTRNAVSGRLRTNPATALRGWPASDSDRTGRTSWCNAGSFAAGNPAWTLSKR
jgi:hypothetical protein